jgi:hypothetical protein
MYRVSLRTIGVVVFALITASASVGSTMFALHAQAQTVDTLGTEVKAHVAPTTPGATAAHADLAARVAALEEERRASDAERKAVLAALERLNGNVIEVCARTDNAKCVR